MKILGIDTTTRFLCLGLYDGGKFYEYRLETGRKLSSLLVPAIQRVLSASGLEASDMDYFACGLGPGSFTGMRIGLAAIKGLSVGLGRPVAGVSTLDILAEGAPEEYSRIVPAVDAKRGLVYCASYVRRRGVLKRLGRYSLLSIGEFARNFSGSAVLGDALESYRQELSLRMKGVTFLDKDYWFPSTSGLMKLALAKIRRGETEKPEKIKPIYLYPKECQIKRTL